MGRRAEAIQGTRTRIIEAGTKLFMAHYYDEVTLEAVAHEAGVTLPTVLRHFESKDKLFEGVMLSAGGNVPAIRNRVRPGDVEAAVEAIVSSLEIYGDSTMRMRHQSERVDLLGTIDRGGHAWHRDWVGRIFAAYLHTDAAERRRHVASLAAALDVYTWRLLRRDYGMSRAATTQTLLMLVRGLLSSFEKEAQK